MDDQPKYALVTGASSGIGWHISFELAQRGYSIIAVSNQHEGLTDLKASIEQESNIKVVILEKDLSKASSAQEVFDHCENLGLDVEVLVNNAGILVYGPALSIEPQKTATILQLHMNTPVMLCRLFGANMNGRGKGFILNVSSISSAMPYPTISLYGPTKTFLRKYSRTLLIPMLLLETTRYA